MKGIPYSSLHNYVEDQETGGNIIKIAIKEREVSDEKL